MTVEPTTAKKSSKAQTATVIVRDQDGEGMAGVRITAKARGKGASVTPASNTTGADGTAEFQFRFTKKKGGRITFTADGLTAVITQR